MIIELDKNGDTIKIKGGVHSKTLNMQTCASIEFKHKSFYQLVLTKVEGCWMLLRAIKGL